MEEQTKKITFLALFVQALNLVMNAHQSDEKKNHRFFRLLLLSW